MSDLKSHLLRFNSIYIKLFIPTILMFTVFGALVFIFVKHYTREVFIVHTKNSVVSFINYYAQSFFTAEDFVLSDASQEKFEDFLAAIPKNSLVRIKVWDKNGRIIYSDDSSIIGNKYENNEEYQKALKDAVVVDFTKLKQEHEVSEKGFKELAEIYVPIKFAWDKEVVGVVASYWKLDSVNEILADFSVRMAILFIVGFLIFYAINLFILYRVIIRRLHKIIVSIRKIMKGDYDVPIYDGTDEIGEVVAGVTALAKSLVSSIHVLEELSEPQGEEGKAKVREVAANRPGASGGNVNT